MKMIESLSPRMSRIINAAWKKDPLYTPNQIRAGRQQLFMLTCTMDERTPIITLPLFPTDTPDVPLVIAGVCAIGEKLTVIFRQTDTVGQNAVAEETLREHCKRTQCAKKGCAVQRMVY